MDERSTWICQADDDEIRQVIDSIVKRYARRYPEYEVMFLALPKNAPEECQRVLEFIYRSLFPGANI